MTGVRSFGGYNTALVTDDLNDLDKPHLGGEREMSPEELALAAALVAALIVGLVVLLRR